MSIMETCTITQADSNYVEKLFYQYNASKDIINFLMSSSTANYEHIQRYIDTAEMRFVELEIAKRTVFEKYIHDAIEKYDYTFNFSTCTIEYKKGM